MGRMGGELKERLAVSSYKVERVLPYRPEQLFDLAADVERYPEFLRGWIAARIHQREGNGYRTDQTIGFGPLRARFETVTALRRPERIDVTSSQAPFRHFRLSWMFESQPGAGCRLTLIADIKLRSALLQEALDRVMPGTIADIIASFETRAGQIYRS